MHINFGLSSSTKSVDETVYNRYNLYNVYNLNSAELYSNFVGKKSYKVVFDSIKILYDYMTKHWFRPSPENQYTATINGYPECDIEFRFGRDYVDPTGRVAAFCNGGEERSKARLAVFFIITGDFQVLKSTLININNRFVFDQSVNECKPPGTHGEWVGICHHPSTQLVNLSFESEKNFNKDIENLISRLNSFLETTFTRLSPNDASITKIALLLTLLFC